MMTPFETLIASLFGTAVAGVGAVTTALLLKRKKVVTEPRKLLPYVTVRSDGTLVNQQTWLSQIFVPTVRPLTVVRTIHVHYRQYRATTVFTTGAMFSQEVYLCRYACRVRWKITSLDFKVLHCSGEIIGEEAAEIIGEFMRSGVLSLDRDFRQQIGLSDDDCLRWEERKLHPRVPETTKPLTAIDPEAVDPDKEQILVNLFNAYMDNIYVYLNNTKVMDPTTGQELNPNEVLMRSIEEEIEISEAMADDFRRNIAAFAGALIYQNKKRIAWDDNPRLKRAIELKASKDICQSLDDKMALAKAAARKSGIGLIVARVKTENLNPVGTLLPLGNPEEIRLQVIGAKFHLDKPLPKFEPLEAYPFTLQRHYSNVLYTNTDRNIADRPASLLEKIRLESEYKEEKSPWVRQSVQCRGVSCPDMVVTIDEPIQAASVIEAYRKEGSLDIPKVTLATSGDKITLIPYDRFKFAFRDNGSFIRKFLAEVTMNGPSGPVWTGLVSVFEEVNLNSQRVFQTFTSLLNRPIWHAGTTSQYVASGEEARTVICVLLSRKLLSLELISEKISGGIAAEWQKYAGITLPAESIALLCPGVHPSHTSTTTWKESRDTRYCQHCGNEKANHKAVVVPMLDQVPDRGTQVRPENKKLPEVRVNARGSFTMPDVPIKFTPCGPNSIPGTLSRQIKVSYACVGVSQAIGLLTEELLNYPAEHASLRQILVDASSNGPPISSILYWQPSEVKPMIEKYCQAGLLENPQELIKKIAESSEPLRSAVQPQNESNWAVELEAVDFKAVKEPDDKHWCFVRTINVRYGSVCLPTKEIIGFGDKSVCRQVEGIFYAVQHKATELIEHYRKFRLIPKVEDTPEKPRIVTDQHGNFVVPLLSAKFGAAGSGPPGLMIRQAEVIYNNPPTYFNIFATFTEELTSLSESAGYLVRQYISDPDRRSNEDRRFASRFFNGAEAASLVEKYRQEGILGDKIAPSKPIVKAFEGKIFIPNSLKEKFKQDPSNPLRLFRRAAVEYEFSDKKLIAAELVETITLFAKTMPVINRRVINIGTTTIAQNDVPCTAIATYCKDGLFDIPKYTTQDYPLQIIVPEAEWTFCILNGHYIFQRGFIADINGHLVHVSEEANLGGLCTVQKFVSVMGERLWNGEAAATYIKKGSRDDDNESGRNSIYRLISSGALPEAVLRTHASQVSDHWIRSAKAWKAAQQPALPVVQASNGTLIVPDMTEKFCPNAIYPRTLVRKCDVLVKTTYGTFKAKFSEVIHFNKTGVPGIEQKVEGQGETIKTDLVNATELVEKYHKAGLFEIPTHDYVEMVIHYSVSEPLTAVSANQVGFVSRAFLIQETYTGKSPRIAIVCEKINLNWKNPTIEQTVEQVFAGAGNPAPRTITKHGRPQDCRAFIARLIKNKLLSQETMKLAKVGEGDIANYFTLRDAR